MRMGQALAGILVFVNFLELGVNLGDAPIGVLDREVQVVKALLEIFSLETNSERSRLIMDESSVVYGLYKFWIIGTAKFFGIVYVSYASKDRGDQLFGIEGYLVYCSTCEPGMCMRSITIKL